MISGCSYQVARPLFVASGLARSERARAPPRTARPGPIPVPNTPKGQRRYPPAPADHDPKTRQHDGLESRHALPYIHMCQVQQPDPLWLRDRLRQLRLYWQASGALSGG
jgi:hypothetical protein